MIISKHIYEYPADFLQNQSSSNTSLENLNYFNNIINKLIIGYSSSADLTQAQKELNDLSKAIENTFDQIQNKELEPSELRLLTTVCRRMNEDPVLERIRDYNPPKRDLNGENILLDFKNLASEEPQTENIEEFVNIAPEIKVYQFPVSPQSHMTGSTILSPEKLLDEKIHLQVASLEDTTKDTTKTPSLQSVREERVSKPIEIPPMIRPIGDPVVDESVHESSVLVFPDNESFSHVETKEEEENVMTAMDYNRERNEALKEQFEVLVTQMNYEFNEQKIDKAYNAFQSIQALLQKEGLEKEYEAYFKNKLAENLTLIKDIERCYHEVLHVLHELDNEEAGYSVEPAKKNSLVKCKIFPNGDTAVKMKAVVNAPLLSLLSLFYEGNGYESWSPFCKESREIKKLSRSGNAIWGKWNLPPPIASREGYVLGMGFDRLEENGTYLLVARTIDEDKEIQERYGLTIPSTSKFVRMEMKYVGLELKPISKGVTEMKIATIFNTKIKVVSQKLMGWVVRKGSSYMLDKIVTKASKLKGQFWNEKYRENKDFYEWLDGRISSYLQSKGIDN